MPSTYTTNLGIEKPATGEQSGTWGDTVNLNYDLFDQAINGVQSVTLPAAGSSGSPKVLAITDGAVSDGRNKFIEFVDGGDLGATAYVQLTPNDAEKIVHIRNSLSGGRSVIVFQGTYNASNDFEIPNGKDVVLKFDGAGTGAVVSDVFVDLQATAVTTPSLTVGTSATFAGTTVADLGTVTTADIDGGTLDGVAIGGTTPAAGAFTTLSATSTDAGATAGPVLDLYRNSASPADDDFIGGFDLTGEDDGGSKTTYARVVGQIKDVTDGTEDADLVLYVVRGGALVERARLLGQAEAPFKLLHDDDGAVAGPYLLLDRESASPADEDQVGGILFRGRDDAANQIDYAEIVGETVDVSQGTTDGALVFKTLRNGVMTEAAKLTESGVLIVGDDGTVLGANEKIGAVVTGGNCFSSAVSLDTGDTEQAGFLVYVEPTSGSGAVSRSSSYGVYVHNGLTNAASYLGLVNDGGTDYFLYMNGNSLDISPNAGNIGTTGGTAIVTVSDERAKIVSGPAPYGLAEVRAIDTIAYTGNGIGPVKPGDNIGFSAQAVQAHVPEAVNRSAFLLDPSVQEKHEGTLSTVPDDAERLLELEDRALIAVLWNAVKELDAEIRELKGK